MRPGIVDLEMQRRFDAAEKIRVGDTPLRQAALWPGEESLRAHFASEVGRAAVSLENPHLEPRVSSAERADAVPAAVLIAVVIRESGPTVLVTRRHQGISYPGHWVFPGGRADPSDAHPIATALREAEEEIGLDPTQVEVLGRLGDYVSHSGFRIVPTVALVRPPLQLTPHPAEVDAIAEIALSRMLDSSNYLLYRFENRDDRAHFLLEAGDGGEAGDEGEAGDGDILLTGVTASICIGLYSELLKTSSTA
jgi:8-oxo-dGTP pyrophosphatase MutT (NUDIX family)